MEEGTHFLIGSDSHSDKILKLGFQKVHFTESVHE